jgi:pimeloyl-ACP methyl ester carboxylesterase
MMRGGDARQTALGMGARQWMERRRMRTLIVAVLLAVFCAACGSDGDRSPTEPGDSTMPGADDAEVAGERDAGSVSDAQSGPGPANPDGALPGSAEAGMTGPIALPGDAAVGVPRPMGSGEISWKPCAESTRECGTLQVPLDYDQPAAGTVRLAVMRRKASGTRVGALLINPGGPGSSAVDYLGFIADANKSPLLARFDVVAFDPRGVGYSTPVSCHERLQQLVAADPSPDDEAEWQAIDSVAAAFAGDCQAAHGALLPHLDTVNVARDMERVRAALGESKLHYLGFSYGTSIGARYAELYPENVGRMVLDGAVHLAISAEDLALEQAKGFERALSKFFGWCAGAATRCTWAQGADPALSFKQLQAEVEARPVPAPASDRPVGAGEFLLGVVATLYAGEVGWRALDDSLDDLRAGDGNMLIDYVDGYLQREKDGRYSNREEANSAVNCIDRKPMSVAQVRAAEARFAAEAPTFGLPGLTSLLVCAHWGATGGRDRGAPSAPGAPPIVVVGTLNDPATPYAWSQALAEQLASGVLVTANVEGHTGYARGDRCVDAAVEAYLFEGAVPSEATCTPAATSALSLPLRSFRWQARLR